LGFENINDFNDVRLFDLFGLQNRTARDGAGSDLHHLATPSFSFIILK
jgi:hypothetical protein